MAAKKRPSNSNDKQIELKKFKKAWLVSRDSKIIYYYFYLFFFF
jgi:hypothetical protein